MRRYAASRSTSRASAQVRARATWVAAWARVAQLALGALGDLLEGARLEVAQEAQLDRLAHARGQGGHVGGAGGGELVLRGGLLAEAAQPQHRLIGRDDEGVGGPVAGDEGG